MSWTVGGRMYHDYAEYQAALQRQREQEANRTVEHLQERARNLAVENARLEQSLGGLQGDIAQIQAVNRRMEANVSELGRIASEQQAALTDFERRSAEEFAAVRREAEQGIRHLEGEIGRVTVDVDKLRAEHEDHVQRVCERFRAVRAEMDQRLAEAERRRAQTEKVLRSEIEAVDAKVEADRRTRLETFNSEMDRARESVRLAESLLQDVEQRLTGLDLDMQAQGVRDQLDQARQQLTRGEAPSALASSALAFASARTLRTGATMRRTDLEQARQSVVERSGRVVDMLERDADAKAFFEREVSLLSRIVEQIRREASEGYRLHRRLPVEEDRHERLLTGIEDQARQMAVLAPVLKEAATRRGGMVGPILEALTETYGALSASEARLADAADQKSDVVIDCDFGGQKVAVRVSLDGRLFVDGWGHATASECGAKGTAAFRALARKVLPQEKQVESRNRQEPTVTAPSQAARWASVGPALNTLQQKL